MSSSPDAESTQVASPSALRPTTPSFAGSTPEKQRTVTFSTPSPHAGSAKSLKASASSPTLERSKTAGRSRTSDPWADPSYRLAVARSTEHREQELSWQWHVYRLKNAAKQIDSDPPHTIKLRRDPAKSRDFLRLQGSAAYRQHEIQLANNALVSRIKTQKSTYAAQFSQENIQSHNSPLVRDHNKRQDAIDAEKGIRTARSGGSSGIFFGSRASRNEQRKIQNENYALLENLKRIHTNAGPYNKEKVTSQIEEHERLVRRRLPRIMHAHPKSLLQNPNESMQPPIHYSVMAAQANSPGTSPTRTNLQFRPSMYHSYSQPSFTQATRVPTVLEQAGQVRRSVSDEPEEEAKQESPTLDFEDSEPIQKPAVVSSPVPRIKSALKSPPPSSVTSPPPSSATTNITSPPPASNPSPSVTSPSPRPGTKENPLAKLESTPVKATTPAATKRPPSAKKPTPVSKSSSSVASPPMALAKPPAKKKKAATPSGPVAPPEPVTEKEKEEAAAVEAEKKQLEALMAEIAAEEAAAAAGGSEEKAEEATDSKSAPSPAAAVSPAKKTVEDDDEAKQKTELAELARIASEADAEYEASTSQAPAAASAPKVAASPKATSSPKAASSPNASTAAPAKAASPKPASPKPVSPKTVTSPPKAAPATFAASDDLDMDGLDDDLLNDLDDLEEVPAEPASKPTTSTAASSSSSAPPQQLNISALDSAAIKSEPLQQKVNASITHAQMKISGVDGTICAEASSNSVKGVIPTAFQFSAYTSSSGELPLALLVSRTALEAIFPASFASFLSEPYTDFTSLLYALGPRFYFDSAQNPTKLLVHLQPDWKPVAK